MDEKALTKREKAKQTKRQLIIKSAMICFIEKGIAQTGIRDIADHAQISLGNLYNHFASKDELVAEIAQIEAEELAPLIATLAEGTSLDDFIPLYLKQVATPEHAILSVEILAAALRKPEMVKPFDANRAALVKAFAPLAKSKATEIDILLDAIEALGMRCGLEHRKPRRAEIDSLRKMAAALT